MSDEHPNIELVRRGYEAFSTGDLSRLDELIDDDVVWHQAGNNLISGTYRGKEELLRLFMRVFELTEGTMQTFVHGVWADDTHAVVLTRTTAERFGRSQTETMVNVFKLSPERKLVERWLLLDDVEAADRFWS